MQSPRKGRIPSAGPHDPSSDRGGDVEAVLALLERMLSRLSSQSQVVISEEIVSQLSAIEDKLTHGPQEEGVDAHLDDEAVYESQSKLINERSSSLSHRSRRPVLYVRPQAGRAVVFTPRDQYFAPLEEVPALEQLERSKRSREANNRRAVVRARDHVKETDCRIWVSATFDDLHIDLDPVAESREYLARLAKEHQRETGEHLHYLGVVASHDARNHLHVLLSADVDPQLVREQWRCGSEMAVTLLDEDLVEEKVGYMHKNIVSERATYGRFLRSRGGRGETLMIPVNDFDEARAVLEDIVYPIIPRLISAQPFGGHPRMNFRFSSIRLDEQL